MLVPSEAVPSPVIDIDELRRTVRAPSWATRQGAGSAPGIQVLATGVATGASTVTRAAGGVGAAEGRGGAAVMVTLGAGRGVGAAIGGRGACRAGLGAGWTGNSAAIGAAINKAAPAIPNTVAGRSAARGRVSSRTEKSRSASCDRRAIDSPAIAGPTRAFMVWAVVSSASA